MTYENNEFEMKMTGVGWRVGRGGSVLEGVEGDVKDSHLI